MHMYAPIFVTLPLPTSLIIAIYTIWSEQNVCAIVLMLDADTYAIRLHAYSAETSNATTRALLSRPTEHLTNTQVSIYIYSQLFNTVEREKNILSIEHMRELLRFFYSLFRIKNLTLV